MTERSSIKNFLSITILTVIILSTNSAFSQSIIVAIEDYDYPPRYFSMGDDELTGIEIDLMNMVAKNLSLKAEFVKCPWNRCLLMMKQGSVDAMPYLLKRPDREEYMLFVKPAYQTHSQKCFFVKKDDTNLIQKYEDLHTIKVGVQKGAAYFSPFDGDNQISKEVVMEEKQLFPMLLRDRFDTFVGACQPLNYIALISGYSDDIAVADYRFTSFNPAHVAISRKSKLASRIIEIERTVASILESGEFSRISEAYFSID